MASEARLQEAQNRLTDCVGPRGIQKLVEEKRKNGILLPFRITLRRHSRLALVTAWEDDFDKTEEVREKLLVLQKLGSQYLLVWWSFTSPQ